MLAGIVRAQSQQDSARMLNDVVIEQSRLGDYAVSRYTLRADSLIRSQASSGSLGDLFRKFGFGHVRSYGPGGAASFASFRGTGSSHTAVLWNGINLVSPLSGVSDLSLVPVTFIDDISVKTGGVASLFGNGSIGGTIRLNNKASFREGLTVRTFVSVGSFGNYFQDLGIAWSGKKFISSSKFFTTQAQNNFTYTNDFLFAPRTEERQHNAFSQQGFLQQNYLQLSPSHLLSAKFWLQDNRYEIPFPTSSTGVSTQIQYERFYRSILGWNFNKGNIEVNYQGALVHHTLDYRNPQINETSLNTFNNLIQNLEGNFYFKTGAKLTAGTVYNWEQAAVDQFGGQTPIRNRIAFFSAFKWKPLQRVELDVSIREEVVNAATTPVSPALTITGTVSKNLKTYISASQNYRLPALNDIYWRSGGTFGNPQLKPELSLMEEIGVVFENQPTVPTRLSFKTAAFTTLVDDWIFWSPLTSSTFVPQNIKKVWSRGVDAQGSVSRELGSFSFEAMFQYSFSLATNESIYENGNPNELNKQLIYTPMHEGSLTLRGEWRGYHVNLVGNYTGKQYTDGDNSEFSVTKAYTITNVWFSKAFVKKHLRLTINAEINNLFDRAYQARTGYPMPGRNYKTGVIIQFNKPTQL